MTPPKQIHADLPRPLRTAALSVVVRTLPFNKWIRREIAADLSIDDVRQELLAEIGRRTERALVITEGLVMCLTPEQVGGLATDLHRSPSNHTWITDLISPGLLRMIEKSWGKGERFTAERPWSGSCLLTRGSA